MLCRADGFVLSFARVNHPELRTRLIQELRRREINFREVSLSSGSPDGVGKQIESGLQQGGTGPVFVYGFETLIDPREEISQAIAGMNISRDYFVRQLPYPFVFWVPDFAMRAFSR